MPPKPRAPSKSRDNIRGKLAVGLVALSSLSQLPPHIGSNVVTATVKIVEVKRP
jgi:hypothetical protein